MTENLIALRARLRGDKGNIYERLGDIREGKGGIRPVDIAQTALATGMPAQHVRAVAEFYDELNPADDPQPALRVCNGEACRAAGADALAADIEGRLEGDVGAVTCLGLCSHGPNLAVNGHVVHADGPAAVNEAMIAAKTGKALARAEPENPIHYPENGQPCILLARIRDAGGNRACEYPERGYAALDQALSMDPGALRAEILASGLRGRGGAGFPIGRKLETVAKAKSEDGRRFVVANLDEGDAGSYIDKELAERDPHALIEGLMISARACGAREAFIYVRHEYPHAYEILEAAIAQARAMGHDECAVSLVRGQGSYVCGEETALLRSIEGLPGQSSIRPPYPAESGLWGRPTAVNNVETLCNLPWIASHGGAAYAAIGMEGSTGTKLVSLNNRVEWPGLYEIEMGVPVREILFERAGGMADGHAFQAVQIGGPLGAILPESALDAPLGFESLDAAGGTLGHAGMVVFSDQDDLLSIGRGLMAFCARESCGKCFPCRIGTARGVELLDHVIEDALTPEREELMRDLFETMKVGSLCGLGGMAPVPIESLLRFFPEIWTRGGDDD